MSEEGVNTRRMASRLHSDLAIPPGEYLAEVMEEQAIDRAGLASTSGIPESALIGILDETAPITSTVAAGLHVSTGVPANIWLGLEQEYRRALEQAQMQKPEGGG